MEQDLPPPPPLPPALRQAGGAQASSSHGAGGTARGGGGGGAFLARRPGFGTVGEPTKVTANHYRVRFNPAAKLFQYDVSIEPEPPKGLHRAVMQQAAKTFAEDKLQGIRLAYDGQKSLFTTKELVDGVEMEVDLVPEGDGPRRRNNMFKITLRGTKEVNFGQLKDFLSGNKSALPQDCVQAMDIVLRQAASEVFIPRGRCFFGKYFGVAPVGGGIVSFKGFYQSIRPAQNGLLTLNIDIAAAPFINSLLVHEFMGNAFGKDPRELDREFRREDAFGDTLRAKAKRLLKGIRVETVHNKTAKRKYRIQSITNEPLYSLRFDMNGESMSVEDYFMRTYNYRIILPGLPAIESGTKEKKRYLPMEVCKIVEGQPFTKTMNEGQKKQLLQLTCVPPNKRMDDTHKIAKDLITNCAKLAREFGVQVNTNATEIDARVLPPPSIQYQAAQVRPGEGSWNMRNKMMFKGCSIIRWTVVNFSPDLRDVDVDNFSNRLPQLCDTYGIKMNPKMAINWVSERRGNVDGVIKHQQELCLRETKKELELLICIMPQTDNKNIYAAVKRVCELELGVVSQCCLSEHIKKARPDYIANLLLKINAKMGGYNALLVDEQSKRLPLISDVPSIIIGADVSHPRVGDDYSPSICSVAATTDWPYFSQYEAVVQTQRQREEVCSGLYWEREDAEGIKQTGGIFKDLLGSFFNRTGEKPHRIIFYRDGVSEGEFDAVLTNEMEAVKKACESLGWGKRVHDESGDGSQSKRARPEESLPKITFIVVQKRHHTRFFPVDGRRTKNGNILPGTIVDQGICHPSHFDFYLCSHFGIKGTSRPAHYHVLRDENNFNVDQIQRLTHDLCFTYARCTRAVSIVPPCYYAHLAACRARVWISGDGSDFGSQHDVASSTGSGQSGPFRGRAATRPLPPMHEKIRRSMFYI